MKKNILIFAALCGIFFGMTSCEDYLETKSNRLAYDPALDQKTDSMFFTLGILKAVQQSIDQYVLVNEMRGDLTQVNQYTQEDLKELANFTADITNKYDSAYLYYRIINNCNYYIMHRDSTLTTQGYKVAIPEIAQAHSIRAWAYMQLCKTYGKVPFVTEPITSISQANADEYKLPANWKSLDEILAILEPDLIHYRDAALPYYRVGDTDINGGQQNFGGQKTIISSQLMFPVNLVLGDLYLETGQFEKAADAYFKYIYRYRLHATDMGVSTSVLPAERLREIPNFGSGYRPRGDDWSWNFWISGTSMYSVTSGLRGEQITYVPGAANKTYGTTSELPALFGFDYYTSEFNEDTLISSVGNDQYLEEREVDPSQTYLDLCNKQVLYFQSSTTQRMIAAEVGDLRRYVTVNNTKSSKSQNEFSMIRKYMAANVNIYRGATVFLRLAEAINRMGYPDAAFAILRDGLNAADLDTTQLALQRCAYVKESTRRNLFLGNYVPVLNDVYRSTFSGNYGIHGRGCGDVGKKAEGYLSGSMEPYTMDTIVGSKIQELASIYGITPTGTINDTINAVEDLICDEYALELAFEGSRFNDLTRLARHKNRPMPDGTQLYSSDWGYRWLSQKLAAKRAGLPADDSWWYLPFSK